MTNPVRIHPLKIIFYFFLILMSVTFEIMWISCHLYPKNNPYAGDRDFQSRYSCGCGLRKPRGESAEHWKVTGKTGKIKQPARTKY